MRKTIPAVVLLLLAVSAPIALGATGHALALCTGVNLYDDYSVFTYSLENRISNVFIDAFYVFVPMSVDQLGAANTGDWTGYVAADGPSASIVSWSTSSPGLGLYWGDHKTFTLTTNCRVRALDNYDPSGYQTDWAFGIYPYTQYSTYWGESILSVPEAVPEPASLGGLALWCAGLWAAIRRRR
ncbi:MAG: PEP-CTERM sorting domain-containing protein [Armatimonadota bacterium]